MSVSDFLLTYWYYVLAVLVTGFLFFREVFDYQAGPVMTPFEATELINRKHAGVLDVRSPEEFKTGHLPNAVNIPLDQLQNRVDEIKRFKTKPLVVVCARGIRSAKAVKILEKAGYENAHSLSGGMEKWKADGLPLAN